MNINLFKKKKGTEKKSFKPKLHGEERARHDWSIMVTVFALLVVVAFGLTGYLFMQVNEGNFFAAEGEVSNNESVITKKTLLDADAFFEKRQKEYDAFVSALPAEVDPSL